MQRVSGSSRRSEAVRERDAALTRVGWARRAAIGGSAALSAAFAWLVSTSPPGSAHPGAATPARHAAAPSAGRAVAAKAPSLPPLASPSQLGLKAPDQSPSPGDPGAAAGSSGAAGNSGAAANTGAAADTGAAGNSGATGNSGAAGNSGAPPAQDPAASAPPPPPPPSGGVVSGGS